VAPQAIVVETPVDGVRARVVQRGEDFAGEAIIADRRHGPFDPPFVARMADARGIDVKVARLRILEKRGRDAGPERVGLLSLDRLLGYHVDSRTDADKHANRIRTEMEAGTFRKEAVSSPVSTDVVTLDHHTVHRPDLQEPQC
jgi:hypothetical protein